MPKVIPKTDLVPIVQGGDTSFSHVIKEQMNTVSLIPRLNQNLVKLGMLVLILVLIAGIILSAISGEISDTILLTIFAGVLAIFIKKGKGTLTTEVDTANRKIRMSLNQQVTTIAFDDIQCIEIICKLKYGGNDLVTKSNELNIACQNGKRFNLATGGDDDVMMTQANKIAEIIKVDIHKDEEQRYR